MKKILSLIVTVIMILSMSLPIVSYADADDISSVDGDVTIIIKSGYGVIFDRISTSETSSEDDSIVKDENENFIYKCPQSNTERYVYFYDAEGKNLNKKLSVIPEKSKTIIIQKFGSGTLATAIEVDAEKTIVNVTGLKVKNGNIVLNNEDELKVMDGSSVQLTAELETDVDGEEATNNYVIWERTEGEKAVSCTNGLIKPYKNKVGKKCEVTATSSDGGYKVTFAVEVIPKEEAPKAESVKVSPDFCGIQEGETIKLSASVKPDTVDQSVLWNSDAEEIASVTEDGTVTGISKGVANITAKSKLDEKIIATAVVNVTEKTEHIVSITDKDGNVTYPDSFISAIGMLSDGDTLTLLSDVYVSDDVDISKACTIDLNDKQIIAKGKSITVSTDADVSIKNGTLKNIRLKNEGIVSSLDSVNMLVNTNFASIESSGTIRIIKNCNINNSVYTYAIVSTGNILDISESTVTGNTAIRLNQNSEFTPEVNINSGTFESIKNQVLFIDGTAVFNINGGKFKPAEGQTVTNNLKYHFIYPDGKTMSSEADSDGYYMLTEVKDDSSSSGGSDFEGNEVTAGQRISKGGTYTIKSGTTGVIYINTKDSVTLVGKGADEEFKNLSIECVSGVDLTIKNLYATASGSNANLINFKGNNNKLNFEGICQLEKDNNNDYYALIHVGRGTSLEIDGTGKLYLYKHSQSACIGGDNYEMNGNVTINGGTIFAKNSKQGALIGGGPDSLGNGSPGDITVNGGNLYLIGVSRAAILGGSAGSSGAAGGGNFYINDGNITMNVDYSGAAIGGGGFEKGNDSDGGTLYYAGGSIRTYVDYNAVNESLWPTVKEHGVNTAVITADIKSGGKTGYLCVFNTAYLKNKASTFNVTSDGTNIYSGGLHKYHYINETEIKDNQARPATQDNWEELTDDNLYFFLPEGTHDLRVNGERFTATYDENAEMGSFTVKTATGGSTHPGSYGTPTVVPGNDTDDGTAVDETIKTDVNVSGSTASSEVTKDSVSAAVKKAGNSSNARITVAAVSGKTGITRSEITIPSDSLKSVKNDTNAELIFKTDLGDISIKNSDISTITGTTGADVKLVIEKNSDGSMKAGVSAGGKDITGGKAALKYRYKVDDSVLKDLADKAGTDNSNLVAVIIGAKGADGNAVQTIIRNSFVDKDGYVTAYVSAGTTISVIANGKSFNDVKDSAWYAKAVGFAVSHKLFEGVSDNEFAPEKSMTRGMFVTVLNRLADAESFGTTVDFSDVEPGKWYATGTAWAASKGIVNGYGDGKFGPNDNVTREQMAVIMYNFTKAMNYDIKGNAALTKFSDSASVHSWATEAMQWAVGTGVMSGNADGTLDPRGTATRAQVATIMSNYIQVLLGVK